MDHAAAFAPEPLSELIEQMRAGGVTAVSPNGVLGDPTGATAQRGQEFFDEMADRLIGLVRTLRRMDGPTPDR